MRKSAAPSQRKLANLRNSVTEPLEPTTTKDTTCPIPPVKDPLADVTNNIRIYNVVYAKPTKKKHKTWEGDGFLEISCKSVTLKDADGKVIGHAAHNKTHELEEGSRLFIGSKEVELVDLRSGSVEIKKRPPSPAIDSEGKNSPFRKKSKKFSNPVLQNLKTAGLSTFKKSAASVIGGFETLVMPRPSEDHQWECNEDHLPVVDVEIDGWLCRHLRPHQREGVLFLYRCVTGIRSLNCRGAILADEMGLGKTLQCITLIWTILHYGPYGGKRLAKRILIVAPSSLTANWKNEFTKWLGSWRVKIFTVDKHNKLEDYKRDLRTPVIIVSYDLLVRNIEHIRNLEFDLIICDEGHRLKNSNIKTTSVLNEILCKSRILLTGTPLQNDLQEFFTLVNFVNPSFLGGYSEFRAKYEKLIEAGREVGASSEAVQTGDKAAALLASLTSGFILRRTQSVVKSYLPSRTDYVVFCSMSEIQDKLYSKAVNSWFEREVHEETGLSASGSTDHLSLIHMLKKICNHPTLLNNVSGQEKTSIHEVLCDMVQSLLKGSTGDIFLSCATKFAFIDSLLQEVSSLGQKIIIVSSFTQTLDVIEDFCKRKGFKSARFDGSIPVSQRQNIVDNFNSSSSTTSVLLLSSKAGGVGLNLIGANRLVLFDSDWNPATDLQAMARIWREGQKKPVHIYRLLMCGTIEEKIFQRQLKKTGLSESVVDPTAVSNVKLSIAELKDLFSYSYDCSTHAVLSCSCAGDGGVPGKPDDTDEEIEEPSLRDCSVNFSGDNVVAEGALRMNQLYMWEHHAKPIADDTLREIGFNNLGSKIEYLFRNKTI